MATTTTNLSLTKPAGGEAVNIAVINANMDKIDTAVGAWPSNSSFAGLYAMLVDTRSGATYATGTSYANAASGITSQMANTSAKENMGAIAAQIEELLADTTKYPNNAVSTGYLTTGGTNSNIQGFFIVMKRGSTSYYGGIFVPIYNSSVPFIFRHYGTSGAAYSIRFLAT